MLLTLLLLPVRPGILLGMLLPRNALVRHLLMLRLDRGLQDHLLLLLGTHLLTLLHRDRRVHNRPGLGSANPRCGGPLDHLWGESCHDLLPDILLLAGTHHACVLLVLLLVAPRVVVALLVGCGGLLHRHALLSPRLTLRVTRGILPSTRGLPGLG